MREAYVVGRRGGRKGVGEGRGRGAPMWMVNFVFIVATLRLFYFCCCFFF